MATAKSKTELAEQMRAAREHAGESIRAAGMKLGLRGETYRQKELGNIGVTGAELALLADLYGGSVAQLFPAYTPTDGEVLLSAELARAA